MNILKLCIIYYVEIFGNPEISYSVYYITTLY
jgi:hypothetical protein